MGGCEVYGCAGFRLRSADELGSAEERYTVPAARGRRRRVRGCKRLSQRCLGHATSIRQECCEECPVILQYQ